MDYQYGYTIIFFKVWVSTRTANMTDESAWKNYFEEIMLKELGQEEYERRRKYEDILIEVKYPILFNHKPYSYMIIIALTVLYLR